MVFIGKSMEIDELTYEIRGAVFEVHRILGIGLFEECYQQALLYELRLRGLKAEAQVRLPVVYKGREIKDAYKIDILVEDEVILELKSVERLLPVHFKQLNNYLHLMKGQIGFLVNFNSERLENKVDLVKVFNNDIR